MNEQRIWTKDFNGIGAQLEGIGAIRTLDDGFQFVDETIAPGPLVTAYRSLLSVGYAKGWI